jgi:bifunctional DNA-binding transcriptional regulator/antitoxin component of YhaV-PrlF toxin-antitoxin module
MTVSKVGQSTLPKWWRDVSGLSRGGVVEVRPLRDGQNSIVLTARPGNRRGISGKELLKQLPAVHGHWRRRRVIDYDLSEHSSGYGSALVVGT